MQTSPVFRRSLIVVKRSQNKVTYLESVLLRPMADVRIDKETTVCGATHGFHSECCVMSYCLSCKLYILQVFEDLHSFRMRNLECEI